MSFFLVIPGVAPILYNLIDNSESGAWLPEINVEAQFPDHFVRHESVEAGTCRFVHHCLSLGRLTDQIYNFLPAKEPVEHMEEDLCLMVPLIALAWADLSLTERVCEAFEALIQLIRIALSKESLESQEDVGVITHAKDAMHHQVKCIENDHVTLASFGEASEYGEKPFRNELAKLRYLYKVLT